MRGRGHAPDATVRTMIRLEALGPRHVDAILAGQDPLLAHEIAGRTWDRPSLDAFLARAARWRADGPLREYAAVRREREVDSTGLLVGGGGVALLGAGLDRGQAALTYWVLAAHRGRGHGHEIAAALVRTLHGDTRVREIILRIDPGNSASQAVARRLGARPVGRLEPHPADARRRVERWTLPCTP